MPKKIGLYFGTFNPIHIGHLIIANHLAEYTDLDQVWFIVSPQNPHKKRDTLLEDYHRLAMVKIAVEDNAKLSASDIEFNLPKPSYTSNTLAYLLEKYPDKKFALIMGEDNLRTLHKWKNYEHILSEHDIFVYPRALTESEQEEANIINPKPKGLPEVYNHTNIHLIDAPVMKLSASFIRESIKEGKDVKYLLTSPVYKYLDEMNFYK